MSDSNGDKISYVTFDGRTIVNGKALLRDPKVKETIEKLSKANERFRKRRGITFLRPAKTGA
ncbi:MAG TPA: hypothetical protein VK604_00830 [Bryobacteraceae bacterium]|nr:hypothetical protein [Bryobacteraceae bacterium]